jgi:hypothetical protein
MRRLLVIVALAAAVWFGWQRLFPSDTAQIEALFGRVAESLTNEDASEDATGAGRAGGLEALARVAALQNEFTVDATVDGGAPFQRLAGRQAIVAAAARVRAGVRNLAVRFPDIAMEFGDNRDEAHAQVTAEARFDEESGVRATDIRELQVTLVRIDGEWKIKSVTATSPLERLDER